MSTVPATATGTNQVLSQFELALAQQAMARLFPGHAHTEYFAPRQSTTPLADRMRANAERQG